LIGRRAPADFTVISKNGSNRKRRKRNKKLVPILVGLFVSRFSTLTFTYPIYPVDHLWHLISFHCSGVGKQERQMVYQVLGRQAYMSQPKILQPCKNQVTLFLTSCLSVKNCSTYTRFLLCSGIVRLPKRHSRSVVCTLPMTDY
jgi:hypothetical protein